MYTTRFLIGLLALTLSALPSLGQENRVTLGGGYAFANYEDITANATGWRIYGLYEFNQTEGHWAHGVSFGYARVSGEGSDGAVTATLDVNTFPLYYSPKYLFGKDKFKGFVKGAFGFQWSGGKKTGPILVVEDSDHGIFVGGGAGIEYALKEKLFLNAEYEAAWMVNSLYYRDGLLNTISAGVGFKF
jgi:hypothetical protein